jgi:hypothetical protein
VLNLSNITANCQTTNIPDTKLKSGIVLIEQGKQSRQLLQLMEAKADSLSVRVGYLNAAIDLYREKDSIQILVNDSFAEEIANLTEQRNMAVKESDRLFKAIKKQKRKTVFAIIGTAAIATAAIIILK